MTILQEVFQYVNKSCLFSEIELDTDLQAVAVRMSANKIYCLQHLSSPFTKCKSFRYGTFGSTASSPFCPHWRL